MSSLATLAHAGHAEAPQFNAIFYATIATVIPVLFVAAVLQEDTFAKLIETSRAAHRRFMASTVLREELRAYIIYLTTAWVPGITLVFGVWGEIQALLDLYLQRTVGLPTPIKSSGPLIAAATLTVVVAIGPIARFGTIVYQVLESSHASKSAENLPGGKPHERRTAPGKPLHPEDNKPSPENGQTEIR